MGSPASRLSASGMAIPIVATRGAPPGVPMPAELTRRDYGSYDLEDPSGQAVLKPPRQLVCLSPQPHDGKP